MIGTVMAGAVAITGGSIVFNYRYMEKTYQAAGLGNYERALYISQRLIATMLVWHAVILVLFVLPRMYKKIDEVINVMQLEEQNVEQSDPSGS